MRTFPDPVFPSPSLDTSILLPVSVDLTLVKTLLNQKHLCLSLYGQLISLSLRFSRLPTSGHALYYFFVVFETGPSVAQLGLRFTVWSDDSKLLHLECLEQECVSPHLLSAMLGSKPRTICQASTLPFSFRMLSSIPGHVCLLLFGFWLVGWFWLFDTGSLCSIACLGSHSPLSIHHQMSTWVNFFGIVNHATVIMTNVFYPLFSVFLVMPRWRFHFITLCWRWGLIYMAQLHLYYS